MFKRNHDIRNIKGDIPFWAIAEHLGVHENTIHNWMKTEMNDERKNKVLKAIDQIKQEIGVK